VNRTLRLLLVLPALTLVGCGAEGDGSRSPITTVEAPVETAEILTQGRDELHGPEDDDADDDDDDRDGEGEDEDKGKGKGKARGHDKEEEG
jgi:hypothetical protein